MQIVILSKNRCDPECPVTSEGEAPGKVIKLTKSFNPPDGYSFRPFRPEEGNEVFYRQVKIAIHHREDPDNNIPWTFWAFNSVEKRPKFVDIWFDPESFVGDLNDKVWKVKTTDGKKSTIFGIWKSVFGCGVPTENGGLIEVSCVFVDAQTAAQFPLRCDGNLVPPSGKIGGEPIELHWAALVTSGIDLDIDSDNNSADGIFGGPDRDLEEDRWEAADENDKKVKLPGKFIPVNDGDADNDQIPGFADFDETSAPDGKKNQFVKAVLDVSNTSEMIVWEKAKVRFKYSSSDPSEAKPTPLDSNPDKHYYTVGDGMIRIWTKDADKARKKGTVDGKDDDKGDFIPGKKAQSQGGPSGEDNGYEFPANKLFTEIVDNKVKPTVDLFIEGIGKVTTSGLIKVEFSPTGATTPRRQHHLDARRSQSHHSQN